MKRRIVILIVTFVVLLVAFGLFASWVDRKLVAKFQNRVGPPIFQPLADLIKLLAKEDIIPEKASRAMFTAVPLVGLAGVVCSVVYIPLWSTQALSDFPGDLIVVTDAQLTDAQISQEHFGLVNSPELFAGDLRAIRKPRR